MTIKGSLQMSIVNAFLTRFFQSPVKNGKQLRFVGENRVKM